MFDTGPATSASRAKLPGAPRPAYLSFSSLRTLVSDSPPQTINPLDSIEAQRAGSENRLRRAWEDIIQRYSRDFDDADEIDITTCEIVVDKGWVRALDTRPAFGNALCPADGDDVTASDGDGDTESDWVDDSAVSAGAASANPLEAGRKERSGIWDDDERGQGIIGLRPPTAATSLRRYEFEIIIPPSAADGRPAPAETLSDPQDRVDQESTPQARAASRRPCLEMTKVTDVSHLHRQKSVTPCGRGTDHFVVFIPPSSTGPVNSATESAPWAEKKMSPQQEDPGIEILWDTLTTSSADDMRDYNAFKRGLGLRVTGHGPDAIKIEMPCKEEKSFRAISSHAMDARSSRDNEEVLTPSSAEMNPVVLSLDEDECVPIKPEYHRHAAHTVKSTCSPIIIIIDDEADTTESAFDKFKHNLSLQQLKVELQGPAADGCTEAIRANQRASSASCEETESSGPHRKRPPPAPPHPSADDLGTSYPAASFCAPTSSQTATESRKRKRVPLGSLSEHQRRRERPAQSDLGVLL
ncbi:hypothetical protein HDU88_004043 [Geranomyces variabilis]|nr:hypothetical protein HDU88_004043 [Geranomyces variabilis]